MHTLLQDLRYGMRMLARNPGFTAVAVLTLALGIGANTAIFSVVDAAMLRSIPFQEADRLAELYWHSKTAGYSTPVQSSTAWLEWQEHTSLFERMEVYETNSYTLRGEGTPEMISGAETSAGLFEMLGVSAHIGRTHDAGEERVAIVGYDLWQTRFAGEESILGKVITLNDEPFTVVGVMPRWFRFPYAHTQVWVPYLLRGSAEERLRQRATLVTQVVKGLSMEEAQKQVELAAARLDEKKPTKRGWSSELIPLQGHVNPKTETALLVLVGAVGFVLLIACANVANLLLSQATGRSRETAIRAALGAGRLRLVRQMLTESLLLSWAGAVLGVLFSLWGVDLIVGLIPNELGIFQINEIRVDQRALFFSLGLALLTSIFFGLLPALKVSRPDLTEALKSQPRGHHGATGRWQRNSVVAVEVALSLVLLVGAGLLTASFMRLMSVELGIAHEEVLTTSLALDATRYPERTQQDAFFAELVERARALPGIEAATLGSGVPPDGGGISFGFGVIEAEGRAVGEPDYNLMLPSYTVAPDYFRVLGIPILRGRSFALRDTAEVPPVVIINQALAQRYWGEADPVGQRMRIGTSGKWLTVVGVAGDVKSYGLDDPYGNLTVYYSYSQRPNSTRELVLRTAGDPAEMAEAVRQLVWSMDKDQPIYKMQTLADLVSETTTNQRFYLALFGAFAGLALLLASFGIYGVVSYAVSQRTHEIGVRMALGAGRRDVLRLVVADGMLPVVLGIVPGLAGAAGLTRFLSSLLFEVRPTDPIAIALVSLFLVVVALLACYLPARRATRVDPMVALRYE